MHNDNNMKSILKATNSDSTLKEKQLLNQILFTETHNHFSKTFHISYLKQN